MISRKTALKGKSGSPLLGEPEYLVVGKLRRPHGVRGDLLMEVITDFPERLKPGTQVFIGAARHLHVIAATRPHADGLLVHFEGIDSPEQAGLVRNQLASVQARQSPALPPGQYYHHQLIGLEIVDEHDDLLGHLAEILQTGANDVYVVETHAGNELLLPVIESVIMRIDVAGRQIHVRVPEGLVPEAPAAGPHRLGKGRRGGPRRG